MTPARCVWSEGSLWGGLNEAAAAAAAAAAAEAAAGANVGACVDGPHCSLVHSMVAVWKNTNYLNI